MSENQRSAYPNAEIMASGGVVRAALSYLYNEMRTGLRMTPVTDPITTLKRIASETKDLPAFEVRGVGSDLDILIRTTSPEVFSAIQSRIMSVTNSAEAHYEAREAQGALKRTMFTVGDVKDYEQQTNRSTSQGGSTIDFLAFDVRSGQIIQPPSHPTIFESFIRGEFEYAAPANSQAIEDGPKQAVRGFRTELELPWLKLADETVLRHDLMALALEIQNGRAVSDKAADQINKMVRNARYGGAHNRFYRAKLGSLDDTFLKTIRKMKGVTLPEFTDEFELAGAAGERRRKSVPVRSELQAIGALLSPDEFINQHTSNGVLFHGTPSMENGLAIMRGGLFISSETQGLAVFGRGAYSSPHLGTAQGYARDSGFVFQLRLKKELQPTILVWEKAKNNPAIQAIVQQAQHSNADPFEVLARLYGIDIIVNQHVLIQNAAAIEFPKSLGQIISAYSHSLSNPNAPYAQKISTFMLYKNLSLYASALGEKVEPVDEVKFKADLIESILTTSHSTSLSALDVFGPPDQTMQKKYAEIAFNKSRPLEHRSAALYQLSKVRANRISYAYFVMRIVRDKSDPLRANAVSRLSEITTTVPKLVPFMVELLSDPDEKIRSNARYSLAKYAGKSSEDLAKIELYWIKEFEAGSPDSLRIAEYSLDSETLSSPNIQRALLRIAKSESPVRTSAIGGLTRADRLEEQVAIELVGVIPSLAPHSQLATAKKLIAKGRREPSLSLPLIKALKEANATYMSFEDQISLLKEINQLRPAPDVETFLLGLMNSTFRRYIYEFFADTKLENPKSLAILKTFLTLTTQDPRAALLILKLRPQDEQAREILMRYIAPASYSISDQEKISKTLVAQMLILSGCRDPRLTPALETILQQKYQQTDWPIARTLLKEIRSARTCESLFL